MVQAPMWWTRCRAAAAAGTNQPSCRCMTPGACARHPPLPHPGCCISASTSAMPRQPWQPLPERPPGQCCRRSDSRRNRCEELQRGQQPVIHSYHYRIRKQTVRKFGRRLTAITMAEPLLRHVTTQETQLSLTNRATHCAVCNGVADP